MKTNYFIFLITLAVTGQVHRSFSQVANDACANAIDLGVIYGNKTNPCLNGTNNSDTSLFVSNTNATPETPYYSMTGCSGYSTSTTTSGNDVWYKFKSENFTINVFGGGPPWIDTVHLNVWYGTDCSNLSPSGCYTFDFDTNSEYAADFSGSSAINTFTYLQFSGKIIGDTGSFGICLKGYPGTPVYNGTTVITTSISKEIEVQKIISVFPNPASDYIEINGTQSVKEIQIVDLQGKIAKKTLVTSNSKQTISIKDLNRGVYLIYLDRENTFIKPQKLIIN